jgi:alkylated DNA repair dioxygenase AlkB
MQLFKDKIELIQHEGQVTLYKGYFDYFNSEKIIANLESIKYNQNKIIMYGKEHLVPRLEAWFGESNYTYTGVELTPQKPPAWIDSVQKKITEISSIRFNSVLVNKYRDGSDYVSWHQDNEKELGLNPIIASLSFGGSRIFKLRNIKDKNLKVEIILDHGDLLIMGPKIQTHWQHELAKSKTYNNTRYNLTFRNIVL